MTGPVIKIDETPVPVVSSRWRTLAPSPAPKRWADNDAERCTASCGRPPGRRLGSVSDAVVDERRCMLRDGHQGLHAWRSLGGLRVFEWG